MKSFIILAFALLFSTQRETLESYNRKLLVGGAQIICNAHLAVLDVLLVQQARILEELGHTSLCDVLNHLLRHVGSLLLGCFFLDFAYFKYSSSVV